MMPDDIITRDSQGQLAVNTVSSTEAEVPYNYDDCFTLDTNGRRALRIVGAGGSGGGAVDSVNGKTGVVVLTGADLTTSVEVSESTLTQELASDTIYNCGEMSSLTITFPEDVDEKYISQVNFTSGTTPTTLSAPEGTIWRGSDVDSNGFTPAANKRYCVLFFYDGTSMRGLVQGA